MSDLILYYFQTIRHIGKISSWLSFQKGYVFEHAYDIKWAEDDYWAPEIHFVNNNYYVYYSARNKFTKKMSIGVAISSNSSNPFGPYIDYNKPIIEHPDGVIDITWFHDKMY